MIEISHLTKHFGRTRAVEDLSLSVASGESVALWGANGAGKTTVIRCVTGLYCYGGSVIVNGINAAREGKRARSQIGYVPQDLGFNDDLRVADAIDLFARLHGIRNAPVGQLLSRVHLDGHERKRMRELSGGMKQRLALAIALIGDAPVLVLDEVTASLDAVGRGELVGLLTTLTRTQGRATLFASHRIEEIEALATRVAMLDNGRLTEVLPVRVFAARFRQMSLLHLSIDPPLRQQAIDVLKQTGFSPRLNGRGILVPVSTGQRMRPIQLLAGEQIAVQDFDLLPANAEGKHT